MSLRPHDCPGCTYGGPHLVGCPNDSSQPIFGRDPNQFQAPVLDHGNIDQKIEPSVGTRLVCTGCGRGDWHVLVLRRKAGLLEGLCKQIDGSGCYPSSSRRNCQYTDSDNFDCPQVAEYTIAVGEARLNPRDVCRDHVGHMLRQGPLYQLWPLED